MGELLDFWNGGANVKEFSQIIRTNFSKTSNNQLSISEKKLDAKQMARIMTIDSDILQIPDSK